MRVLPMTFVIAGVVAAAPDGARRDGAAGLHQHRSQHHAVPDPRTRPDHHVSTRHEQRPVVRLAVRRRVRHRPRPVAPTDPISANLTFLFASPDESGSVASGNQGAAGFSLAAARPRLRRLDRLRRPGQRRGQRQRRSAVRLPARLGDRGRQRDGGPGSVPVRQAGPRHRALPARVGGGPHPHARPGSPTGCRPNWSPWQRISPKSSAVRSPCTCCSISRC